jgi:hypothetical protein
MLKKFFNGKEDSLSNSFVKKTLSKNIYSKYYVRKVLDKSFKKIEILDGDTNLVNLRKTSDVKTLYKSQKVNFSLYQHQKNKNLVFNYINCLKSKNHDEDIKRLYALFYRFHYKKKMETSFFLHSLTARGFKGVSSGVLSFLHEKKGQALLKKALWTCARLKQHKSSVKKYNFFNSKPNLLNKLLVKRLKGNLISGRGFNFLKTNQGSNNKGQFFDFVFTNFTKKHNSYALKKRNKNKNFKSRDKKFSQNSIKSSTRFKKFSRKKNFEISTKKS